MNLLKNKCSNFGILWRPPPPLLSYTHTTHTNIDTQYSICSHELFEVSHPQKPASQFYTCETTHLENEIIFWDSNILTWLQPPKPPSLAPQTNRSKQENQAAQLHNWALLNDIHNDDDDDEKYSTYYSIGNT